MMANEMISIFFLIYGNNSVGHGFIKDTISKILIFREVSVSGHCEKTI